MVREKKTCCVFVAINIAEAVRDGAGNDRSFCASYRLSQFSLGLDWMKGDGLSYQRLEHGGGRNGVRCYSDEDSEWPSITHHVQVEPPPVAACRPVNESLPAHQETDGDEAAASFVTT